MMGDLDVGEMVLDFILDKIMRPYCGFDLGKYIPEELTKEMTHLWESWMMIGIGFKWSQSQAEANMEVFGAEFGHWIWSVSRERSSNWRGVNNFVEDLEA